jgi:hypothetical protein
MEETTQEKTDKTISMTGQIPYIITVDENKVWSIQYQSTIENDIAALAVAQFVLQNTVASLEVRKKNAKGKELQSMKALLDKSIKARFGIEVVRNYMQALYFGFKKREADFEKKEEAKVLKLNNDADGKDTETKSN